MPRLAPLDLDKLTPEQKKVADAITAGPRGGLRGPFEPWLRSPLLADRAQAQDAECGAGQCARDAPPPVPLLLVLRDPRVGLGEVKERAQDVLRHLHPVRPARAGKRQSLKEVLGQQCWPGQED